MSITPQPHDFQTPPNANEIAKSGACQGRIRVSNMATKWYLDKNKSSMLYTCCEDCYNKYIIGTPQENDFEEYEAEGSANCDYFLYNTDCNFQDCSIVKHNIRVSIIDIMGNRFKLHDENTFLI